MEQSSSVKIERKERKSTYGRSLSVPEASLSTSIQTVDLSSSTTPNFYFLKSIRDLTQQELTRANPLGILGKEIISVTGTTHCPEPLPPKSIDENEWSSMSDIERKKSTNFGQQEVQRVVFTALDDEQLKHVQRSPTTIKFHLPTPGEYLSDQHLPSCFFSPPSSETFISDFIPPTMTINVFEVFIYAWGVAAFFFDMVTDLVLAHAYYIDGAYWLFIMTLMCVMVPNLTLSIFSLVWYIDQSQLKTTAGNILPPLDNSEKSHTEIERQTSNEPAKGQSEQKRLPLSQTTVRLLTWLIRIIVLVLQLDLCLKYIRGLYYTWKGFRKRNEPQWQRFYLTKQILIDADIALLRVFDCFMDSASQVTLQLYIMLRLGSGSIKFDTLFFKQTLSIVSSLGSLAYALSGYSRCWRHMQLTHSTQNWPKDKPKPKLVSWWSTIIQWIWYLFLISSRVLALAMFAATFRSWFWIIVSAHWWAMLFWILRFRTIFCISDQTRYNPREAIFEKCYNIVCSYIFIFCYMNLRQGNTRRHYIAFYTIYYIENVTFAIIYAIYSIETNRIVKYSLVIFVLTGFWLAILFQFFYYRFLHPNTDVRLNAKEQVSSIVHLEPLKRARSSVTLNHDHDSLKTIDQQSVSVEEACHNRFAKENRRTLHCQHRIINKKLKMNTTRKYSDRIRSQHVSPRMLKRVFVERVETSRNNDRKNQNELCLSPSKLYSTMN